MLLLATEAPTKYGEGRGAAAATHKVAVAAAFNLTVDQTVVESSSATADAMSDIPLLLGVGSSTGSCRKVNDCAAAALVGMTFFLPEAPKSAKGRISGKKKTETYQRWKSNHHAGPTLLPVAVAAETSPLCWLLLGGTSNFYSVSRVQCSRGLN